MYKVESDFTYKDYRCVVVFTDMGHRCGYVGIPMGHELYQKGLYDYLNITKTDMENEVIGKRGVLSLFASAYDDNENVTVGFYFNIHGGLTYADDNRIYPVDSNLWWLGFDCDHYGDGIDLELMARYWGDDPNIQRRIQFESEYLNDDPVRSKEYAEDECKSLVDQIIELISRYNMVV